MPGEPPGARGVATDEALGRRPTSGPSALSARRLGPYDHDMQGAAVLVHGAWSNPHDWRWVAAVLEADGVDVRAVDLPSHRSTAATRADDVAEVTTAIRASPPPVVVMGWSYGGTVIDGLDPDRLTSEGLGVLRLVYVATLPTGTGPDEVPPPHELDLSHVVFLDDGTCVLDDDWWLAQEEVGSLPPEVQDHLHDHRRRPITLGAWAESEPRCPWRKVATTLVLGRSDTTQSPAQQAWAADRFDDVRIVDGDHFVLWRAPEVLATVVEEALEDA